MTDKLKMRRGLILLALFLSLLNWTLVSGQNSFEILNKGIGGNAPADLLNRMNQDVIADKPDLVLLMVGTNDLLNSSKMISLEKYESNLRKILSALKSESIDVVLMSPPPADTVYLFERHNRSKYTTPPNEMLAEARKLLKRLSREYNFLFIDIYRYFKNEGIPDHNRDDVIRNEWNSGSKDGVHLTARGNQFMGLYIFNKLLKRRKINKTSLIICFGDSLTFGASMEGAGTSTGDTYPAVLRGAMEKHFSSVP